MKRKLTLALAPELVRRSDGSECVYQHLEFETDGPLRIVGLAIDRPDNNDYPVWHTNSTLITGHDVSNLCDDLFKYILVAFDNDEQRKAFRSLVDRAVYDWYWHRNKYGGYAVKEAKTHEDCV